MEKHDKEKKSVHLKELEEVFEAKTRRFSPFAVLGLTQEHPREREEGVQRSQENKNRDNRPTPGSNRPPQGSDRPTPGSKIAEEKPISLSNGEGKTEANLINTDTYTRPRGGSGTPMGGVGRPTRVVVVVNKNTTTIKGAHPGVGLVHPPSYGSGTPTPGSEVQNVGVKTFAAISAETSISMPEMREKLENPMAKAGDSPLASAVVASRLGGRIGAKARKVLAYLNSIRSFDVEACTVPVGYTRISGAAGVDADYLRRKVLPKLAMLGLIAIERKGLDGTIYRFSHPPEYLRLVTSETGVDDDGSPFSEIPAILVTNEQTVNLPEWVDKEHWGWLSPDTVQRLIEKAGSEARAKEKLEIIVYNETHGSSEQRVRNKRSILAHYLASPQAEIWPNDNGFETLELRQSRLERDRARQEKTLAEEALQTRQEANRIRFFATLSEAQRRWLKQEVKRLVDARPEAKLLKSRYLLYRLEEDKLAFEWMDRTTYGEKVPDAEPEESVPQSS